MDDINNWQDKFEICSYAKKLIDKITHLNNIVKTSHVDILEVKKAIFYAKKYHGVQIRQSGELYYSHPIEVAYMVAEHTAQIPKYFRTDIIVTALLHDTIEDTELNEATIACLFGAQVASQVEDLTRIKSYGKISAAEILSLLYKQKKYHLILIKLLDRQHNMQTIGVKPNHKIQKIITETLLHFVILAIDLEIPIMKQQILEMCYIHLASSPRSSNLSGMLRTPFLVLQNAAEHKQSL
jgi:(p)ppGpp synthase/HD superfamily hydrolase